MMLRTEFHHYWNLGEAKRWSRGLKTRGRLFARAGFSLRMHFAMPHSGTDDATANGAMGCEVASMFAEEFSGLATKDPYLEHA